MILIKYFVLKLQMFTSCEKSMWKIRGFVSLSGSIFLKRKDITSSMSTFLSRIGIVIAFSRLIFSRFFRTKSSSSTFLLLYSVFPTPGLEDFMTRTVQLNGKKYIKWYELILVNKLNNISNAI